MGLSRMTRRGFNKSLALGIVNSVIPASAAAREGIEASRISEAVQSPPDAEWTMERALKEWKPMTRAVAHVGVPGYDWQAGVLWDGSLVFGPLKLEYPQGHSSILEAEAAPLGNHRLHLSVGYGSPLRFLDRAAAGNPAIRLSVEEGRLPMPHVQTTDGGLLWDQAVFADLLDRRIDEGIQPKVDDMLVVYARFKVRNLAQAADQAHLWLHFGNTSQIQLGYKVGECDAEVGHALDHYFKAPLGKLEGKVRYVIPPPAKGTLIWHDRIAAPAAMRGPLKNVIEWEVALGPGEEAGMEVRLPYGLIDQQTAERLARVDSNELWTEVQAFWRRVLTGPGSITTPDGFVNDYAAAVVGQMSNQLVYRHQAGYWMYKSSPNHYENLWPPNAAIAQQTFDMRGLSRYSRPVLKSFIDTQSDDVGALLNDYSVGKHGQVKGEGYARVPGYLGNFRGWTGNTMILSHGLELYALAAHYRITRDREWLGAGPGSPLQAILEAFDWVSIQRRRTMREEDGQKVPHWGLLPAASTDDWLSGNTIANDAWTIYGLIEAAQMLREIEHPRAEELIKELRDYRACLRARYREARDRARPLPLPDGSQLPYVPRDIYELDWAKMPLRDWLITRHGPVRAGAWGALDPDDELVTQALVFLDAGMPKGEGPYLLTSWLQPDNAKNLFGQTTADENFRDVSDPDADRHFLWKHYVEYESHWPIFDLFLQRDDLPRFFEAFFNYFAIAIHRGFRVGVESLDGAPSNTPADSERWQVLRRMFANERGGFDGSPQTLWLLQAIPRTWLKPGDQLSVQEMSTHFGGRLSLDCQVAREGKSVEVSAKLDLAALPKEIRLRLRSGAGRPLAAATINGANAEVLEADTIQLPAQPKGEYRIVATFN